MTKATTAVEKLIRRKIQVDGPLRFDQYMALCLSAPKDGYYRKNQAVGRKGDFITAPEISQIFGEMCGIWLAEKWQALGSPSAFTLLELGPGRGTLMADALGLLSKVLPSFFAAADLVLLEQNQTLVEQQGAKLGAFNPDWIESCEQLDANKPILGVANEFFDALPVRVFNRENESWKELFVVLNDGQLEIAKQTALNPATQERTKDAEWLEQPEISLSIAKTLATKIAASSGAMLCIDYGDWKLNASGPTVQAVKNHQKVDLFTTPGETDLSAHVDFSLIAEVFNKHGEYNTNFQTQSEFLISLGSEARLAHLLKNASASQAKLLNSGHERLTDPSQMGELFKVLEITNLS